MYHLVCNALVHVMYSGVSGQCSHTIRVIKAIILLFDYKQYNTIQYNTMQIPCIHPKYTHI